MKAVLSVAVFSVVLALAYTEECRTTADCGHVTCPETDYTLDCANRQCTCTHATATCSAVGDCHGNCDRGWHCIDGKCRCGFGFGGGGGVGK